jgi:VanZ family protein
MSPTLSLNRDLLAIYLIAVLGLLLLPISVPKYAVLGIKADKLVHIALFAGMAALMRWNISRKRYASILSLAFVLFVILFTEAAQSFMIYRSGDWGDVIAGSIGALIGVVVMNRIMSSASPEKLIGVLVSILGGMIITLSLFVDLIRQHGQHEFGPAQIIGTALGVILVAGGAAVYFKRFQNKSLRQ